MGQLNLTVWAWIESVRGLRQRAVWSPFLAMAAAQALMLLLLTQFYQPVLSLLIAPLVRLSMGTAGLHYPQFYLGLPELFSQGNLIVDWLLGSFLYGAAYLLIWRLATGSPRADSWGAAGRAYGKLLLLRVPALVVLLLVYEGLPRLLATGPDPLHGNALRLARLTSFLCGVLVEGILLYAPLALLAGRRSVAGALRDSLALAARTPLATFLVVCIPNLVQIPLSAAFRRTDDIVVNLVPETVAWLVLAGIVVYVAINYLAIAPAVRIFGARARALEGGRP